MGHSYSSRQSWVVHLFHTSNQRRMFLREQREDVGDTAFRQKGKCCYQPKHQRRSTKTLEFMAYLKTIVHVSKSFNGDGWVTYDLCYRCKAAAMGSLDWSQVHFTIHNETFAGRAKAIMRCKYCNKICVANIPTHAGNVGLGELPQEYLPCPGKIEVAPPTPTTSLLRPALDTARAPAPIDNKNESMNKKYKYKTII